MSLSENTRDPWLSIVSSVDTPKLEFEDTFVKKRAFQPLDDSQTYLATLGDNSVDLFIFISNASLCKPRTLQLNRMSNFYFRTKTVTFEER